jgi:hypothetical protein
MIASLLLGYALGVKLGYKPCYYLQYYLPRSMNPMVEKSNVPFYDGEEEDAIEVRNEIYYCALKQKMNE